VGDGEIILLMRGGPSAVKEEKEMAREGDGSFSQTDEGSPPSPSGGPLSEPRPCQWQDEGQLKRGGTEPPMLRKPIKLRFWVLFGEAQRPQQSRPGRETFRKSTFLAKKRRSSFTKGEGEERPNQGTPPRWERDVESGEFGTSGM